MNEWMKEWMDGLMNEIVQGWMGGCELLCVCMYGTVWMNGRVLRAMC